MQRGWNAARLECSEVGMQRGWDAARLECSEVGMPCRRDPNGIFSADVFNGLHGLMAEGVSLWQGKARAWAAALGDTSLIASNTTHRTGL